MILIDRVNQPHELNVMLLRDVKKLHTDICKAYKILMLDKSYIGYTEPQSNLNDNIGAINRLLPYVSNDTDNFDLVMIKQALVWFMGMDIRYDKGSLEEQRIIQILFNGADNSMTDKLEVGTMITDRNGNEFKAFSLLFSEYEEAIELLLKINIIDITQNIDDTEAQEALLEIIYRALNKTITKKKILKSLDAEFARKIVRVYFDLPIGA
ncbi:hypothetical protein [Anaerosinus massiliensis]|uniref:hypothetical protein n=1 Tax=Massilibacillus massiliensis TaxID=1806837 RepID=UPI000DA5F0F6|nr:hypothetical protein [Massilibacillus massiliensis]